MIKRLLKVEKDLLWPIAITLLMMIFILLTFIVTYSHLPHRLPLFYSHPWGESELVSKIQYLILPSVMILVTITNLAIATHLHSEQKILRKVLTYSVIFIDIIILITAWRILWIFI